MTTKAERKALAAEAREKLTELLPPGSTVYTVLDHVSRSGMSHDILTYVIHDNEPRWLSSRWLVALGVGDRSARNQDAVRMGGAGMDMGSALVYNLSQSLYPRGFGCTGKECPSNDHSNGDRDYTPHRMGYKSEGLEGYVHWHESGGYALKQRWL